MFQEFKLFSNMIFTEYIPKQFIKSKTVRNFFCAINKHWNCGSWIRQPEFPKDLHFCSYNVLKFFIKKNNGNQLSLTTTLHRDLLTVHWFALYFCDGQKSHSVAEDNPGLYLIIAKKYTFATTNCYWTSRIFLACEYKFVWSICIKLYLTGIGKISWFSSENIV